MRILFDQGTPAPLRHALDQHTVATAYERGWSTVTNGDLLTRAEIEFDVLITTDQNLRHQQRIEDRDLAVLVLPTTSWPRIRENIPLILQALTALEPGTVRLVEF